MKFYAHVADETVEATLIVTLPTTPAVTVDAVCDLCAGRFDREHGTGLLRRGTATVVLTNALGVTLRGSEPFQATVKNGDDVWLMTTGDSPAPALPTAAAARPEVALQPGMQQFLIETLESSTKLMQAKNFKAAAELHRKVIEMDPTNMQARYQQALIELSVGAHASAQHHLEQALTAQPKPQEPELFIKLGEACDAQATPEGYDAALQHFDTALGLASGSAAYDDDRIDNIKILMAKTLQKTGNSDVSLQLVTSVLKRSEQHKEALVFYGAVVGERGDVDESMRVYLRLLVTYSDDKVVREAFSSLLANHADALDALREHLREDDASSGPAYAFLASIVKDYGGVDVAAELYAVATRLVPSNTNSMLSYVHTLELSSEYADSMEHIDDFAQRNPSKRAGVVTAAAVAQIFRDIRQARGGALLQPWADGTPPPRPSTRAVAPPPGAERQRRREELGADSLDFVALLCTACKIAFVVGDMDLLAPLVSLLAEETQGRDLHKTLIRNEAAYFGCARQLVGMLPPVEPQGAGEEPCDRVLYVLGDSHCLSCGWHTLRVGGQRRTLRPMLVTGLKCWHMRAASRFYPTVNLERSLAQIPPGAEVIFIFGEIDCREGLLVAVEKCRYKDVDAGIAATVDIYMRKMAEIQSASGMTIFVHPVPPVLDVTRDVVRRFNVVCKARVEAAQNPSIRYLDFEDQLLGPDGKLVEGYGYDGTHLHPDYLPILEAALEAARSAV